MIRPLFSFLESDYHSFQMLFLSLLLEPLLFFKDILTSFQKNYLIFILVGSYKFLPQKENIGRFLRSSTFF